MEIHRGISAPTGYWELTDSAKAEICNGCGQSGKFDFVPDQLLGLVIAECCNVHDYQYMIGATWNDKREADINFLANMLRAINAGEEVWRFPRRRLALDYYQAVSHLGDGAFWAGKDRPPEE